MQPLENESHPNQATFVRSKSKEVRATWMLDGFALFLTLGIFGFAVPAFVPVGQLSFHFMSTLPMVLAFSFLYAGWHLSRSPRRVVVDDGGIQIEQSSGERRLSWSEIGWVNVTGVVGSRVLVVYDGSGKKTLKLGEGLEDFDNLLLMVKSRIVDEPGTAAHDIKMRKARQGAVCAFLVGLILLICTVLVARETYQNQRAARRLKTDAVEGTADIDKLIIAPNRFIKRVEYTVTSDQGETGTRRPEIKPAYYNELKAINAQTIPVLYVPDEPQISRLQRGEVPENDVVTSPVGGYTLAALGGLLSLGIFASAGLLWSGWDLDIDSKTGKFSIKRFGEGA